MVGAGVATWGEDVYAGDDILHPEANITANNPTMTIGVIHLMYFRLPFMINLLNPFLQQYTDSPRRYYTKF